jgi:acetoin utilization deacetylase AcuC-like enzyme
MSLGLRFDTAEMSPARALLVDDARFEQHISPPSHPERPERLVAARRGLATIAADFTLVAARPAVDEELVRVHDPKFLERLGRLRGRSAYIDPDTFVSPESLDVARLAAGSLVSMVDRMIDGPVGRGIALLRPPGHHAGPARAMGFCLLNNVAIAAAHARARGLDRVAIIDWDVHHGNGTQDIFWRDPHTLYISTHQFPFYPGTGGLDEVGDGDGSGFTVNVPLAAGGNDALYVAAFQRVILPILESYAPELVLVSAGFDASARDPLAQMELSADAFGWMARELARVADASAGGKIALVLEGGYDLGAIEAGVRSAVEGAVLGRAADIAPADGDDALDRAARAAKKAWSVVG